MAHSPELLAIAALVYAHAEKHYNEGGWDTVVECYSHEEIADEMVEENISTLEAAIAHFVFSTDLWRDHDEEMMAIANEERRLAGWDDPAPEEYRTPAPRVVSRHAETTDPDSGRTTSLVQGLRWDE